MNSAQTSIPTRVSFGIALIVTVGVMYGFGTFGLLNLFGARTLFQLVFVTFVFGILVILVNQRFPQKETGKALLFFGLMGLGGLIHGGFLTSPVESAVVLSNLLIITILPDRNIVRLARVLVGITFVLCSMILIAYIYYRINPSEFLKANFNIYDSTVGAARVIPTHFMDWISFTSGDGFVAFGEVSPRMKGYSNEPSSTVVHYLAPAVLAFLIGGRYLYPGIFILIVNVIAIASFTGHVVILLSFVFFLLFFVARKYSEFFIYIGLALLIFLLLSPAIMTNLFTVASGLMGADMDLIQRKLGDGVGPSSLSIRQEGMIAGLTSLITSPLGYSLDSLGAGAGLLYIVSAQSGWIGIAIFVMFISSLVKMSFFWLNRGRTSLVQKYGLALMTSVIVVALFISGYGWGRPVGFINIFLFFLIISIQCRSVGITVRKRKAKSIFALNVKQV